MKIDIISMEYKGTSKGTAMYIYGRNQDNQKITLKKLGPNPYFYVTEEDRKEYQGNIAGCIKEVSGFKSIFGESLRKLEFLTPNDVWNAKDLFPKTYEADLRYTSRFLIDKKIYHSFEVLPDKSIKPCDFDSDMRKCFIDIETDYAGGSNDQMTLPITAISFYDSYEEKYYTLTWHPMNSDSVTKETKYKSEISSKEYPWEICLMPSEKAILNKFINLVRQKDYDIFTGWNVKKFDMTYIITRMMALNLDHNKLSPRDNVWFKREREQCVIQGRVILDLLQGYRRILWKQIPSFKLDEIGKSEFKIGKVEYKGWIRDFWKNDFKNFLLYNVRDIDITVELDKKYTIITQLNNFRKISGCEFSDVHMNSRMIDTFVLRKCNGKYILPSKVYRKDFKRDKISGGFVLEPKPGLLRRVAVFDLKSLYPSIMMAFNLSPERVNPNGSIKTVTDLRFDSEDGLVKMILLELIGRRDEIRYKLPEIKDKKLYYQMYKLQYSWKTFTNSFYGVLAYPNFRLFNDGIAETITKTGQFMVKKIIEFCQEKGYEIVRADTDSVFIEFGEEDSEEKIIKECEEVNKGINHALQNVWFEGYNADTKYLKIKFEKLYRKFFSVMDKNMIGVKKNYAGHIVFKDGKHVNEIEIKGFAAVRSDKSKYTKELQRKVLEMILEGKELKELKDYVLEMKRKMISSTNYEYIGIPKGFSKSIHDYAIQNPWIRGIKFAMKNIEGYEFSPKPYLIYVNHPKTKELCINSNHEFPKDFKIDWNEMTRVSIKLPLEPIFRSLYTNIGFIDGQKDLGDFYAS